MNRKEVIEQAKEDIKIFTPMKHPKGYIKFVVKRKERKVIGYIKSSNVYDSDIVYEKTVSKCHEDDTFNEFIGKAIVAHRIFNGDVPEYYTNDYKKETPENGDVVLSNEGTYYVMGDYNVKLKSIVFDNYCTGRGSLEYIHGVVIDDTCYIEEFTDERNMPNTTPVLACYDRVNHDCGGSCQGASDCILSQYYKGIREEMPTKKEMREYIRSIKKEKRMFNKIIKSIDINIK